jgi:hypothetical protein
MPFFQMKYGMFCTLKGGFYIYASKSYGICKDENSSEILP